MIKIAVTGPISSGKSTVCELLAKHKAYVISADEVVHKLLKSNINIQNQISHLLNKKISFHTSDYRKEIADLVFNDSTLLLKVEQWLHPLVLNAIQEAYSTCLKRKAYSLFVCEVPLLFETGMDTFFDKILYVMADEKSCIQRFCTKTNYDAKEWKKRMSRFSSQDTAKNQSSFIIVNNGTIQELETQINQFLNSQL